MQSFNTLASVVFPAKSDADRLQLFFNSEQYEVLYGRKALESLYDFDDRSFSVPENHRVTFDKYFSVFSAEKWHLNTTVENLYLRLAFEGQLLVKVRSISRGQDVVDFFTIVVNSTESPVRYVKLPDEWKDSNDLLTIEITAVYENAEIFCIDWCTNDIQSTSINLSICITTFNRQKEVLKSISKIKEFVLEPNKSLNNITLYVIDNGNNLVIPDDFLNNANIKYVSNKNLGGAGGFSRGLYETVNAVDKEYTHCLFMDDDASCYPESIIRSVSFLSFSQRDSIAIAGTMLFDHDPYKILESGARFDGLCRPLKYGLDVRDLGNILENDRHEPVDYGGWWFFIFPLKYVSEFAFPFFVRGDDSNFSMQHDFDIRTLNGVGSWQEDFAFKASPLTEYLDLRYHILHCYHIDKLAKSGNLLKILKIFWRFLLKDNLRYFYATAEAEIIAFEDVMKGPDFWSENYDGRHIFSTLPPLIRKEKLSPYTKAQIESYSLKSYNGNLYRLLKLLTLNGHLWPKKFFPIKTKLLYKTNSPVTGVFLSKSAFYHHTPTQTGVLLDHDKKYFFKNLLKALWLSVKYSFVHKSLKKQYQNSYKSLTSPEAWKERFFGE